jgi:cytochrome c553
VKVDIAYQQEFSKMISPNFTAFPLANNRINGFLGGFVVVAALSSFTSPATADPALGKAKVQAVCTVCHGVDGIGKNPDVPNLAGESAQYIQKQLKAFRSGARQHDQMSIIAKDLSDKDIANVADWFSSLKVTVKLP